MEQYKPPTTKLAFESDKRYDVFLSFRGPDVRKTLVDHLYEALSAAGLNVFLDSHKLEKGEIIGLSLERAIESSAIRIPIFSKGYADSAWCLKEAAAMLRTPGLIIPFFYHVDPTHVRYPENESSPYNQAFIKHYGHSDRYPKEEIDEWKRALEQICSRSGWTMDITQGYEARLVKMVVNDLMKTLDKVSEKKDNGGKKERGEKNEEAKTDEKKDSEGEVIKDSEKVEGDEKKDATVKEEKKNGGEEKKATALKEEEKKNGGEEKKAAAVKEEEKKNGSEEKAAAVKEEENENGGEEIFLMNTVEENKNEFRAPKYVIDCVYPPQLFSDENPNACSIM